MREVPALISIIENIFDIHAIATKCDDFSQTLLENQILKNGLIIAMVTHYLTPCFVKSYLFSIFFRILTEYFKQTVILSFEVIYGTF